MALLISERTLLSAHKPLSFEVHIFNFSGNLLGKKIKVHFIKDIRDEKNFQMQRRLKSRLKRDIKKGKGNFGMKKPELLAPAGDFEKLKTAIHYGADAVYLGDSRFSLRGKAGNFEPEELKEAIRICARRK